MRWRTQGSQSFNTMHRYNTRFATMNLSFNDTSAEDGDYVPNLRGWNPTNGRRPVTRSMTTGSTTTSQNSTRNSSRVSHASMARHHMSLRSSRR